MRYILIIAALFCSLSQISAQNNITYGAGISYTNGAPSFVPPARTSRVAIDTITGKWYHFNTPGGWQLLGNTIEEIAGCSAPAYTPTKGDSKIVINNCTEPELYYWTGSVWVWINQGTTYTAGQGIRIESNSIILDSLYILRFRTGSNTDGAAGTMSWNATEETVDLVTDQGAVTGHLMESAYYNTRNTTGTPITIGRAVMAAGTTGNTGRILIAPAIADGTVNSEYILGITAQTIGNNANGKVQHFGKIRGIQTNGANFGETWVDDDVLFCSAATPGYLTKVQPAAPNLKVPIATVIHAHPSNGTLFIRPSHFPDLNQINDVQLTSPTTGQTLIYNASTGVWSNQTPADSSSTNELQTLSVAANTATLSNGGGSVTIAGAGINTVGTAGTTITVTGTEVDGSVSNELQTLSTGTNTLTLSNGGGTVTVDTDPASDVTGSGASGQVSFWTGAQTQSGDNGLFWNNTTKRLGIGTTSPTQALHLLDGSILLSEGFPVRFGSSNLLNGNTQGLDITNSSFVVRARFTNAGNLLIGNTTGTARLHVVGSGSTSSTWTAQFHNSAGNNNALMIRDDGNVGVGTSSPIAKLHIEGNVYVPTGSQFRGGANGNTAGMSFWGTTDGNTGWGGFMGRNMLYNGTNYIYATTNSINLWGTVAGIWVNGRKDSDSGRALRFIARPNTEEGNDVVSTSADRNLYTHLSIGYDGIVSVGTVAPNASAKFEVASTTQGVLFPRMTTTQRNAITTPADGLVIYNTTDNKLQVRAAGSWVDLH
jgi:hypothetical protein